MLLVSVRVYDEFGQEVTEEEEDDFDYSIMPSQAAVSAFPEQMPTSPLTKAERDAAKEKEEAEWWDERSKYSLHDPSELPEEADLSFLDAAHRQMAIRRRLRKVVQFYYSALEERDREEKRQRILEREFEDGEGASAGAKEADVGDAPRRPRVSVNMSLFEGDESLPDEQTVKELLTREALETAAKGDLATLHVLIDAYNVSAAQKDVSKEEGGVRSLRPFLFSNHYPSAVHFCLFLCLQSSTLLCRFLFFNTRLFLSLCVFNNTMCIVYH